VWPRFAPRSCERERAKSKMIADWRSLRPFPYSSTKPNQSSRDGFYGTSQAIWWIAKNKILKIETSILIEARVCVCVSFAFGWRGEEAPQRAAVRFAYLLNVLGRELQNGRQHRHQCLKAINRSSINNRQSVDQLAPSVAAPASYTYVVILGNHVLDDNVLEVQQVGSLALLCSLHLSDLVLEHLLLQV